MVWYLSKNVNTQTGRVILSEVLGVEGSLRTALGKVLSPQTVLLQPTRLPLSVGGQLAPN